MLGRDLLERATGHRHWLWLGSPLITGPADAGSDRARGGFSVIVTVSLARMFLVAVLLLTPVVLVEAADQKASASQEAPAPSPSPVIPLAEVASRAMEVEALLRSYRTLQASTPATSMIEQQLPEASALIGLELERTLRLLRAQPTLETLEVRQELWVRRQFLTTTWLDALTRRVTHLQEALTRLGGAALDPSFGSRGGRFGRDRGVRSSLLGRAAHQLAQPSVRL